MEIKYLDPDFIKNIKPKLVRDKIPNIIVEQNKSCTFRKLGDDELKEYQLKKIYEELDELKEAIEAYNIENIYEELADVIEIIASYINPNYSRGEDLIKNTLPIIEKKYYKNGGFNNHYLLEKVVLNDIK